MNNFLALFWRYISFFRYFPINFSIQKQQNIKFCVKISETLLVILSTILLPIKSPLTYSILLISLFEAVLSASVADCLA